MWNAGGLDAGEDCLGGRSGGGEETGCEFEEAIGGGGHDLVLWFMGIN